jgi:hypothetical protein
MRCNLSGPLAAALLLSVASVPCPASWLDDTTHNVGVEAILAPKGTIDSGGTVAPRCVVANYGDSTADLWTYFAIDGAGSAYLDSLWLTGLAPAQRETVAFPEWIPRGRDSMTAIAWTECAGDTFPDDDTCTVRFLVRVTDVAVVQIIEPQPDTVIDSSSVLLMRCRVWNFGNQSLNFDLRFRIYKLDSTVVFEAFRNLNLIAGGATVVTSPDSWTAVPGVYVAEFAALVSGDLHPENNVVRCTFYVRGTITRDVAVGRIGINLPPDSIYVGDTVIVNVTVVNLGDADATFWAFFFFQDSGGGNIYAESSQAMLNAGESTQCEFTYVFTYPGTYTVACSVCMPGDQNPTNDVKRLVLHVLPVGGVEESPKPQASSPKPQPTVVRRLSAGAVAFDAMGRRVVNPKPGVYFVREEPQAASLKPQAMRKVVLQR